MVDGRGYISMVHPTPTPSLDRQPPRKPPPRSYASCHQPPAVSRSPQLHTGCRPPRGGRSAAGPAGRGAVLFRGGAAPRAAGAQRGGRGDGRGGGGAPHRHVLGLEVLHEALPAAELGVGAPENVVDLREGKQAVGAGGKGWRPPPCCRRRRTSVLASSKMSVSFSSLTASARDFQLSMKSPLMDGGTVYLREAAAESRL